MSRCGKKERWLNAVRTSDSYTYDVTLNDFADSSRACGANRLKKSAVGSVVNKVKQLSLDDDDDVSRDVKVTYLDVVKGKRRKRIKVNKASNTSNRNNRRNPGNVNARNGSDRAGEDRMMMMRRCRYYETGNMFPIEIWYLLSNYICPEDVGNFAAVCRGTWAAVSTAKFWSNLYKRYYRKVADLPERLQPQCMDRRYGLRTSVIRALHFMYPPFVQKLKPLTPFDDPHTLVKRTCVLSWSQEDKNRWLFYFKLKKSEVCKYGRGGRSRDKSLTLVEKLQDIAANPDNNCKVLQVMCENYSQLPMISGQVLSGVSLTSSRATHYYMLSLAFDAGPVPSTSNSIVSFNPVLSLRIWDWWHPMFPHFDAFDDDDDDDDGDGEDDTSDPHGDSEVSFDDVEL